MTDQTSPAVLADEVAKLSQRTEELTAAVKDLDVRASKAERVSKGAAGVVILAVVALIALAYVAAGQTATSNRLQSLIQDVMCPVMALTVGGYDPSTRPLNPDGSYEGSPRERYVVNAGVMDQAFRQLDCDQQPVPPRTTGS